MINVMLLLIYDLFKENSNTKQDSGKALPIKKFFVKNNEITIDKKTLSSYGYNKTPTTMNNFLQESFDMPLDTMPDINLPNKLVASRAFKPYVIISGTINTFKKNNAVKGSIIIGFKKDGCYGELSIPDQKRVISPTNSEYKINKKDYFINNKSLYEAYQSSHILTNDTLSSKLFEKITNAFFDFICSRDMKFPHGKTSFNLYILPSDDDITYTPKMNESVDNFIDSFGNDSVNYSDKVTKGVTFFSCDDKAFTINCKTKEEFYKSLGVGSNSLDKVLLPQNKKMNVEGLDWYFFDLNNAKITFTEQRKGIFLQMYENYIYLKNNTESVDKLPMLIVLCVKKTKAKLEILIHENLSMPKLDAIFKNVKRNEVPFFALESLRMKKGSNTIFTHYIHSIKSVLNQTKMDPEILNKIYTSTIHDKIRDWLTKDPPEKPKRFFEQSEFCITIFKNTKMLNSSLESATEFAKHVGEMTREYVDFRKSKKLENNSYKSVLQKNIYTIPVLQDVIKQIGRSLHLLKLDDADYDDIVKKLSAVIPTDIDENATRKDLSYYFYHGYFRGSNK